MKNNTKPRPLKSVCEIITQYAGFTTIGAVSHAKNATCHYTKAYWIIILLVGYTMTYYATILTFLDYFEYNTMTSVSVVSEEEKFEFPAVTICNSNRIHCRNLLHAIQVCEKVCIPLGLYTMASHSFYSRAVALAV